MHGDEIVYSTSEQPSSSASTFSSTSEQASADALPSLGDELSLSSPSTASHPIAASTSTTQGDIACIFRYVNGILEGRCEKFGPGACVQVSHWHRGLLHGESAMYVGGVAVERAEYRYGYPISADAEAKSEDIDTRAAAADDMRLAELQMAAWEAECRARASAAAAAAAAADAKAAAASVFADMLSQALLQSEDTGTFVKAAAAEVVVGTNVGSDAAMCNVASSLSAEPVDDVVRSAAAAAGMVGTADQETEVDAAAR
jgi:biotin carboxyl carrier protein